MTHNHDIIDPACTNYPLYDSRWEHDACGTGFLVQVTGEASHTIVQTALEALARLTHRGAQDADAQTSDGAGILTQIPRVLFLEELDRQQVSIANPEDLAVGMIFLPSNNGPASTRCRQIIEQTLAEVGLVLLGWRTPPVDCNALGTYARETAPEIAQVMLTCPAHFTPDHYVKMLYYARRMIERKLSEAHKLQIIPDCYIVSLSHTTIVYKGLMAPKQLPLFYRDLADPCYTSAFAIFHQRYSTNTFPSWPLAQPLRMLAHNGEINTLEGNRNWMQAREGALSSPFWIEKLKERLSDLVPVLRPNGSDSAHLDNVLELLAYSGRDILQSMQMLVPPAWECDQALDDAQRAWCEYHAGLIEPWDGPAALVFTDGNIVGAALDRNGLRPARYMLTAGGLLIVASETGVVSVDPGDIIEKGRLGPGEMLAVDLQRKLFLCNAEIKQTLADRQPYREWIEKYQLHLSDLAVPEHSLVGPSIDADVLFARQHLFARQQLFGYSHEDIEMILRPMLRDAKEPTWSMGDDTPLAVLSTQERPFSDYFRQRFAQVTNPPIDPLRERVVISLDTFIGPRESLLTEVPQHAHLLHLETPLMTEAQLEALRQFHDPRFRSYTLATTFDIADGPQALEAALDRLEQEATAAIHEGAGLLILSDQDATLQRGPIPMAIAVGAVHYALVRRGLRSQVSLICETGTVCDIHQIALVFGYGAGAIVPTLALASVRALAGERQLENLTPEMAVERYLHVVEDGLCKVMARMGISTIRNIIGPGQFDIVGLAPEFVERCFAGSAFHPGKVSYRHIAGQLIKRCQRLQDEPLDPNPRHRKLIDLGLYRFRRDAEYHAFNPLVVRALQKAAQTGKKEDYRQFTSLVYSRPPTVLRDLLSFVPTTPIPLEEVEPMEAIRTRFVIAAMSVGALSPWTHRTIAAAMNSIGARNNTGEGGEDPAWYHETLDGVACEQQNQASCFGSLRRYHRISGTCRRAGD